MAVDRQRETGGTAVITDAGKGAAHGKHVSVLTAQLTDAEVNDPVAALNLIAAHVKAPAPE